MCFDVAASDIRCGTEIEPRLLIFNHMVEYGGELRIVNRLVELICPALGSTLIGLACSQLMRSEATSTLL